MAPLRGHLSRDGLRPVALREDDVLVGTYREVKLDANVIDREAHQRSEGRLDLDLEKNVDAERTGQLEG